MTRADTGRATSPRAASGARVAAAPSPTPSPRRAAPRPEPRPAMASYKPVVVPAVPKLGEKVTQDTLYWQGYKVRHGRSASGLPAGWKRLLRL